MLLWKTLFLVAITSAHRVSDLAASNIRPPFLVFLPHAVQLCTNISFLPKVVSEFHMNSKIILPDFFPSPSTPQETLYRTLDVTRAWKFYWHSKQFPDRHQALFVSYSGWSLVNKLSSQQLSKWVVGLTTLCYSLSKIPLPASLSAHSTRAMVMSAVFLEGVPLHDICEAAMWKMPMTFIKHYTLESRAVHGSPRQSSTAFQASLTSAPTTRYHTAC